MIYIHAHPSPVCSVPTKDGLSLICIKGLMPKIKRVNMGREIDV